MEGSKGVVENEERERRVVEFRGICMRASFLMFELGGSITIGDGLL